jgi:hypothetical protein
MKIIKNLNLTRDTHGKRPYIFYRKMIMSVAEGVFVLETWLRIGHLATVYNHVNYAASSNKMVDKKNHLYHFCHEDAGCRFPQNFGTCLLNYIITFRMTVTLRVFKGEGRCLLKASARH